MNSPSGNSFTYRAAVTALPFTLAPIVFDIAKHYTQDMAFLSVAVSIIKLSVITTILYICMRKYTQEEGYVPYGTSFRYGFLLCTFSSIICTLWYILNIYVIFPDTLDTLMETISTSFGQMNMDFDYDQVMGMIPPVLIISSFISCLVWGLILSAILANFTKNDSPFAQGQEEEQTEVEPEDETEE